MVILALRLGFFLVFGLLLAFGVWQCWPREPDNVGLMICLYYLEEHDNISFKVRLFFVLGLGSA